MNQKFKVFSNLAVFATVLTLILIGGCSDNFSVNSNYPDSVQSPAANANARLWAPSPIMEQADDEESVVTQDSKMISEDEGGEIIIVRDKYEHIFKVDPEAVDEKVEITVSTWEDKVWGKKAIVFDFGPDGLVFKEPAKLIFDMDELNHKAEYAILYYYNPDKRLWVLQSVNWVDKGEVVFEIDHFSKYAISD